MIERARRIWNERFMRAMARLEDERQKHERCGGCGRLFCDHPPDFDDCLRKVLAQD